LDEIGNHGLSVQAKLLNFLQDFTVERLGSNVKRRVHTRIIAAVNRPLDRMVKEGKFREDLYFRLNAIKFILPPLRDRKEDIPVLCAAMLEQSNQQLGRSVRSFSAGAYQKLLGYHWPGNIRELANVIQKAVLFCDQEIISAEHLELPESVAGKTGPDTAISIPTGNSRALRREHVEALLERNNGILRWAAREAGISEATLYRKIKKFGMDKNPH
jgi:transcriptional regulator with PAS, ATPase and Fis domain